MTPVFLTTFRRFLGSLPMAVSLLLAIAAVLAWGTIHEARFGTEAAQQAVYRAWWFQGILGFLAVNLAVAALERWPWQRRHVPFVSAHVGIILMLLGGIVGGRFGIEGQLIIPEGASQNTLQLSRKLLVASEPNPGVPHLFPTDFEARAWVHEPNAAFRVPLADRAVELVVDRYYPDALVEERVSDDGPEDNPAVHAVIAHDGHEEALWLLAHDRSRFAARWGEAHLLFLEPSANDLPHLLESSAPAGSTRGQLTLTLPGSERAHTIPVPESFGPPLPIEGTPYTVTFKDYFSDFALTKDGVANQSQEPNNPAVSFTLSGPEGTDAHLLFAFHPEFARAHGLTQRIPATLRYTHPAAAVLPGSSIAILRVSGGSLAAVCTGADGQRQVIPALDPGTRYRHPWLGYEFVVTAFAPRARLDRAFTNRSNEVRSEALHVVGHDGDKRVETWLTPQVPVTLEIGRHNLVVEYRPAERELPFTITLLDFRKIDYPGTEMAAGFESDIELTDPQRGIVLMRKISMNNPLRYRGYSFFQASYIEGSPETTVLSARNDPGTPLVYAGFLVVIAGIASMFILRTKTPPILNPMAAR